MRQKNSTGKIEWDEQFKIRIRRNASIKHEHIKLEIVRNLIEKHKSNLYWIRVYTEYSIQNQNGQTKIVDVYFENIKNNEILCYEIQNNVSEKWVKETKNFYDKFDKIFFKTDWILIKERHFPEDINKIAEQIKDLVF